MQATDTGRAPEHRDFTQPTSPSGMRVNAVQRLPASGRCPPSSPLEPASAHTRRTPWPVGCSALASVTAPPACGHCWGARCRRQRRPLLAC
eukprot:354411-Chlamydomonas_euryale.AAC.13